MGLLFELLLLQGRACERSMLQSSEEHWQFARKHKILAFLGMQDFALALSI